MFRRSQSLNGNTLIGKLVHKINDNEFVCLCDSKDLINIHNWDGNRPADVSRAEEIRDWIISNKQVPGIIHLSELNSTLVCYDGGHRLKAIKRLGFGLTYKVIIHVIYKSNIQQTRKRFKELNKLIELPEMYKTPDIYKIRYVIEECIKKLIKDNNWDELHKPTHNRPRTPCFNKDKLSDKFLDFLNREDIKAIR